MEWLMALGIAICLAGLGGIIHCILRAMRLRNSALPESEMRSQLQRLVPVNYGSVLLSILGLCLIIVGMML